MNSTIALTPNAPALEICRCRLARHFHSYDRGRSCRLPTHPPFPEAPDRLSPYGSMLLRCPRGCNRWLWQFGALSLPGRKMTVRARSTQVSAAGCGAAAQAPWDCTRCSQQHCSRRASLLRPEIPLTELEAVWLLLASVR